MSTYEKTMQIQEYEEESILVKDKRTHHGAVDKSFTETIK